MKNFLKKNWKWLLGGLIVLIILRSVLGGNDDSIEYVTEEASRSDIVQYVSVTGSVESTQEVELRFSQTGDIEAIKSYEGDQVTVGESLIVLDRDASSNDLLRTQAGVDLAQAELDLLNAGPRGEEIRISETKITEAQINLDNSENELDNVALINDENLREAELNLDTAESDLTNAEVDYENTIGTEENDTDQAETDLENAYADLQIDVLTALDEVEVALDVVDDLLGVDKTPMNLNFDTILNQVSRTDLTSVTTQFNAAVETLEELESQYDELELNWGSDNGEEDFARAVQSLIEDAKDLVNDTYTISLEIQSGQTAIQNDIDTVRANLNTEESALNVDLSAIESGIQAIENAQLGLSGNSYSSGSALSSAEAALESAQNAYEIAESNLITVQVQNEIDLDKAEANVEVMKVRLAQAIAEHENLIADPRSEEVSQLTAKLNQARASYYDALDDYNEGVLLAPASGVITEINYELGESVSTSEVAVKMITDQLQIKVNISETEIAKVSDGDPVEITFDAFSLTEVFAGEVISINPAETVIQGVVYYEATVLFDAGEKDVRSGMTANVEIISDTKEDALTIAPQSLQYEDGMIFVYVLEQGEAVRRDIVLGLEGDDRVEVLDGVNEGDDVVLYEKK